jgi:hypothetical protein
MILYLLVSMTFEHAFGHVMVHLKIWKCLEANVD